MAGMSRVGKMALAVVAAAIALFPISLPASAATTGCLDLTRAHGLSISFDGLDLTRDQKRELVVRVLSYNSLRGYQGLDGLGLTSQQITTIEARMAAKVAGWNAHPLGWPCAPFTHRARTVAWVRARLIANDFAPASLRVTSLTTRQIQMQGTQNGVNAWITVARSGGRGISIGLTSTHSGGGTFGFALPFVP